uniref:Large ribosomal subunit protein bL32m n=1 Tax=Leptobrachium leishanense TaxID=445787 RepID=A0A8C5PCT2_9ANUR
MALPGGSIHGLLNHLFRSCLRAEQSVLRALGLEPLSAVPALAIQTPSSFPPAASDAHDNDHTPSFLDSIFWMAAPKSRRTIEVNRCRRRNPNKLIKVKENIDMCPECGHLKLKHVLCGFCYAKVSHETIQIRAAIKAKEGGPFNASTVETVVLYQGEKPRAEDTEKRIIERSRKRPSWFSY